MRQDRIEQGWAVLPLFDWRRVAEDRQIGSLPVTLREQLAITAQRVAATFEFGAQVRERIAARREAEGDYYRSRAAWNRAVARLERAQADALRAGCLLATPFGVESIGVLWSGCAARGRDRGFPHAATTDRRPLRSAVAP